MADDQKWLAAAQKRLAEGWRAELQHIRRTVTDAAQMVHAAGSVGDDVGAAVRNLALPRSPA